MTDLATPWIPQPGDVIRPKHCHYAFSAHIVMQVSPSQVILSRPYAAFTPYSPAPQLTTETSEIDTSEVAKHFYLIEKENYE